MNLLPETWLWTLALLGVSALLLALPFWPVWVEWRTPCDGAPLPTPPPPAAAPGSGPVQLANGIGFETLQAPQIVLGEGALLPAPALPPLQAWQPPASARRWGEQGWHIPHDLHLPAGLHVRGPLVVRGHCTLHGPGLLEGDLKAHGRLHLGAGYRVQGSVFSQSDIQLDDGSQVSGVVLAEGRLHISPQVAIGAPAQPVSVCAQTIVVQGPAQVHGSVHARVHGQVLAPRPASAPVHSSIFKVRP